MKSELQNAIIEFQTRLNLVRKELHDLDREYYLFLDDLLYERGRLALDRQGYIKLAVIGLCRYNEELQRAFYYFREDYKASEHTRHKTVAERVGRLYANRTAGRKELVELLKQWERITDRDLLIEINKRFPSKKKKRKE